MFDLSRLERDEDGTTVVKGQGTGLERQRLNRTSNEYTSGLFVPALSLGHSYEFTVSQFLYTERSEYDIRIFIHQYIDRIRADLLSVGWN